MITKMLCNGDDDDFENKGFSRFGKLGNYPFHGNSGRPSPIFGESSQLNLAATLKSGYFLSHNMDGDDDAGQC